MRFALLGQLTAVNDDGGQVLLAGARLRVLLAALLLDANTPISTEALAEAVWDGAPPPAALETLRSYIRRLRRALGPVAEARIAARYPGYLIQVAPEELDVLEFEVLYRRASSAARESRWTEASDAATLALDLWRGDPLLDVRSQVLYDAFVPRLQQFRMRVLEDRIEAELGLGHHKRLIPELKALTGQNPLHERFHARLMLALFRAGRPAEALDAYQRARRTLIDELGVEPGAELRRVHERILAGDPDLLEAPRPTSGSPIGPSAVPRAVPRQLPAGVRHFVGRAIEIKTLSNLVGQASADAGAMVVSAISGGAGIGKTALAIHWAHLNADRFPDGQLYVNLRGFDPSGTPSTPAEALRGFLRALDIPAQSIPADPADQATLYRSRLADQRMLIVLDNACEVDQIRPLLPGSPGCMVLVTSRNQLGGLVALDGAVPMTLDLLSSHEALDLLITRLGRERVLAEEQTASELVALCARLPLALNLAAARAALHPRLRLSELVDGLRDARRLLDTLALGDDAADPRAVFSWSYRALDPLSARVFRLLSMHPGPHITLAAVASLAALDPDVVREILGTLTAAYLITEQERGRYGFHDLLRAYAAEQADAQDSEVERREALRRVCDYYAHSGYAEELVLNPNRSAARFDPPVPGVRSHATSDQAAAVAWFEAEHANILAAQQVAITRGWHATVWQLAWVLRRPPSTCPIHPFAHAPTDTSDVPMSPSSATRRR
jgi:DNA-binding SARP family transcriptional activator